MKNQYKVVYSPNHSRAFSNGCVFEHFLIAERYLGRPLNKHEVVHHLNFNKKDNSPENLIVFVDKAAHTRFHNLNANPENLVLLSNGAFDCRYEDTRLDSDQMHKICPECGSEMYYTSIMCVKCRKSKNRERIPDRDALRDQILSEHGNFTRVANFYGVSDNAVRKWCKSYGLPFHSREWCKHGEIV